jgi:hypothetical protein
MNHQRNKPNLQEPMNNEDGACLTPTLVNDVTSINPKTKPKYSESTGNLINKLRETLMCITRKSVHSPPPPQTKSSFTIICIYRSPTGNFTYFLNQLESILKKL